MDWPHKVSVWLWQGESAIFDDIPCLISDYVADRLLPPSEFGRLGRSQQRLLSYRMRCPMWVYPFLQELSPIAITPSPNSSNPFGRHFDATSEGESLFISDISIHAGILDIYLDSLVTNPLGMRDINSSLFVPNPPLQPLPPKPIRYPDLRWYWEQIQNQADLFQWGIDGFPTSSSADMRMIFTFEGSRLQPYIDVESQIDINSFIQNLYNLPDDLSTLKFSFIDADENQYNLLNNGYSIEYRYQSVTSVVGVLGLGIRMRNGFNSGVTQESLRRLRFYPSNGQKIIVYGADNTAYYDDRITSNWGDATYTTTA